MSKNPSKPNLAQALSHETADKRLEILRQIGEVGSISEAARRSGVSYKAAWQALETLSNLAGTPLVGKVVGGAGGGGAELTDAGHKVLTGATLLAQARAAVFAQLAQGEASSWTSSALAGLGLRTSMRNHLPCQIVSVKKAGALVRVVLDLGDGNALASRITHESAQLLALLPGLKVLALCKATAVNIADAHKPQEGANVLVGTVTRSTPSTQGGELSIQLSSGHQVVGFACMNHGLKAGAVVTAQVDESAVVIALAQ
jgi:molybdate transport system regulatory protein